MAVFLAFVAGVGVGLLVGVWLVRSEPAELALHQRPVIQLPVGKGQPDLPPNLAAPSKASAKKGLAAANPPAG
jgi:hypothetical protein